MIVVAAAEREHANETNVDDALFHVELRTSESRDVLVLTGDVNLDAAHQLCAASLQGLAGRREVAVDWTGASRVGAGALQALLALSTALQARGRGLSVVGDNPCVRHMLELAGLTRHFPIAGPAR